MCTVIDHGRRHSVKKNKKSRYSTSSRVVLFSSFHSVTLSVIYYRTHARQNEIYLLNIWRSRKSQKVQYSPEDGSKLTQSFFWFRLTKILLHLETLKTIIEIFLGTESKKNNEIEITKLLWQIILWIVICYSAHSPLGLFSNRLHQVLRLLLTQTSYFYDNWYFTSQSVIS